MNCPSCNSSEIKACGKRNVLYPVGIVAIIGLPFAMLHKIASPHDYHCNDCGMDFARRTTAGRIAWVALLVFIVVFAVLAVTVVVSAFTE